MDKTYKVPKELWERIMTASNDLSAAQVSAVKAAGAAKKGWEEAAAMFGLNPPTVEVVDEDAMTITGELLPPKDVLRAKDILTVVSVLRDKGVSAEEMELIAKLFKKAPVRLLGAQVEMLYEGASAEDAYSKADGVVAGKLISSEVM